MTSGARKLLYRAGVLSLCLLLFPSALSAADALGRLLAQLPATVNGVRAESHATVYTGDQLVTRANGWLRLLLEQGNQIHLEEQGEAWVRRACGCTKVLLVRGQLVVRANSRQCIKVIGNGLEISADKRQRALWKVIHVDDTHLRVEAQEGTIRVQAAGFTYLLAADQSLTLDTRPLQVNPARWAKSAESDCGVIPWAIVRDVALGTVPILLVPAILGDEDQPVSPSGL
ncbi:MAG: hypothetical protein ACE5HB_05910 [Terriglobia bacterium]